MERRSKFYIIFSLQFVDDVGFREMVSLIPRLSSFAVSGTPAKTQPADLIHVLRYVTPLLFLHNHLTRTFQINIDSYEWIRLLEVHDFGKGC